MRLFKDIQDKVWYSLNSLRGIKDVRPKEAALSDYFISRQYINLYSPQFIKCALGDIGEKLITFANLVDADHPNLTAVFNGFLEINSNFSEDVLEVLEIHSKVQGSNFNRMLPALVDVLHKRHSKEINFISDLTRFIHLFKDDHDRDNFRFLAQNIELELKASLYPKMPSNFKTFIRDDGSYPDLRDYYGFRRTSMTNAAIVLAKLSNIGVPRMKVFSYHKSYKTRLATSCTVNSEIRRLIDFLDAFPACKMKPIFDRFWIIDSGHDTYAMLGEHDSKCYFIICWN